MTKGSIRLRELAARLNQAGISAVSCDIFDTLIFRAAGTQDQFWLALARQAQKEGLWLDDDPWAFVARRKAAEAQARAQQMQQHAHQEVMLTDIYASWPSSKAAQLSALEMALEYQTWRLNFPLVELLQRTSRDGRQLLLISDMYLPSALILHFLHEQAPGLSITAAYISGECGVSKHNGGIFQYVLTNQGMDPAAVIHIGDDRIADKQMAIAAGIGCFHVPLGDDYLAQLKYEQRLLPQPQPQPQPLPGLEALRRQWMWNCEDGSPLSRLAGLVYGPVLFAFARWVVARCQQLGVRQIFCLLREGELIAQLIRMVPGHSLIVSTLAVSRRSSFLPSLKQWSPDLLHPLAQRRGYTLHELLEDIGLDCPDDWDELVCQPLSMLINHGRWRDIIDWVASRQDVIEAHLQQQRILLQRYLQQQGVHNSPEVALLDWGCGGSLLHNLCDIASLDDVEYFMFYSSHKALKVALQQHLHVFQPAHCAQWAAVLATSPELTEILLNGTLASTRGYTLNHGVVVPVAVLKPDLSNDKAACLNQFQYVVLQWARLAANNNWLADQPTLVERQYLLGLLYRLVQYPTWQEAETLKWLPVPLSQGLSQSLLDDAKINILETIADNGAQAFTIGRDGLHPLVHQSWWYPGLVALTFPGQLQSLGELACSHDDDKVGPLLLKLLQQHGIQETALYGAGELGLSVTNLLVAHGIHISHVIDRRAETSRFTLAEHEVITLAQAQQLGVSCFTVASRAYATEITDYIKSTYINVDHIRIFSYLDAGAY